MSNAPIGAEFSPNCPWMEQPSRKRFQAHYVAAIGQDGKPVEHEVFFPDHLARYEAHMLAMDYCKEYGLAFLDYSPEPFNDCPIIETGIMYE